VDHFVGHHDTFGLQGCGFDLAMFHRLKGAGVQVKGVYFPPSGAAGFIACVQIKKVAEGEQMIAATAAASVGRPKLIVIVDEETDIYDEESVLRAIACNAQPDLHMQIIRDILGTRLDPSMTHETKHSMLIIDATKPIGEPFPVRLKIPQDVMEKVKLEELISKDDLQRVG
jgi:UbiD family decarboxylase